MSDRERRRRFFAPEVVQTSAMDCGPASLKCLLEGYGVQVSYERLRDVCQTDVDGTSIDAIEDVAGQLGLEAAQIMLPVDLVLLSELSVLPAVAVVRLPSGATHFVVLWRHHGPVVQVMDPASGRRWFPSARFLDTLYLHEALTPVATWRQWVASERSLQILRVRLARFGAHGSVVDRIVANAETDPSWRTFASVDAAARMAGALVRSGAVDRGIGAWKLFERLYVCAREGAGSNAHTIPRHYWSVREGPSDAGNDQVLVRGAVLVTVSRPDFEKPGGRSARSRRESPDFTHLSPQLLAALEEPRVQPWRIFLDLVRVDGVVSSAFLVVVLAVAATGVLVESFLFRALFDIGSHLPLFAQRASGMLALVALLGALLLIEFPIAASSLRLGRQLESRLRMAFLEKIPRLADNYFRSRPLADMAERSHTIHQIRLLPELSAQFTRAVFELILTALAISWIDPPSAPIAVVSAALSLALPIIAQPILQERDLRVRTHSGALGRFYLDSLQGLVAVRTHVAERAIRREHEALLVEWGRAGLGLQRAVVTVEAMQLFSGFGLAVWLLLSRSSTTSDPGDLLLLAYWILSLPLLGQEIARIAWQYPGHRNLALRLLEPLGVREDTGSVGAAQPPRSEASPLINDQASLPPRGDAHGVSIRFDNVTVQAARHTILDEISLDVPSGAHIAIVGASGAGKSSLVGLLLGWHRPTAGCLLIDGRPLDSATLNQLRRDTAWVDPTVQIWNRSLVGNVLYGADGNQTELIGTAIDTAHLREVLDRLPDGMETTLGESGRLLSGGEGQRVRLARSIMRPHARLVILDEPFRGLERDRRRALLLSARRLWQDATLLCVTHDVSETLGFAHVVVMNNGRIIEAGEPSKIAEQQDSRYRTMLEAERTVQAFLREDPAWRTLTLNKGRLVNIASEAFD